MTITKFQMTNKKFRQPKSEENILKLSASHPISCVKCPASPWILKQDDKKYSDDKYYTSGCKYEIIWQKLYYQWKWKCQPLVAKNSSSDDKFKISKSQIQSLDDNYNVFFFKLVQYIIWQKNG